MAKNHVWRIKKEYFHQLRDGKKKIEVRVGYPSIQKVREGDSISFENYGRNIFKVVRVAKYPDFSAMLEFESAGLILPGCSRDELLKTLNMIYPPNKTRLGIYAFELKPANDSINVSELEIVKASSLLKSKKNKKFAKVITDSYRITEWISKDYPDHCEHFFCKYVPGIFTGEREIISCYLDSEVVATAVLKNADGELKISTLYVRDSSRGKGIATALIKECFDWLGTTKPVATIADYKLEQFEPIIRKYGWVQTKTLNEGFYNDHSCELVYNDYS